jgi:hypothetical protein
MSRLCRSRPVGGKVPIVASALSLIARLALSPPPKHKCAMTDDRSFKDFVRWATTPPQAYLVYAIALVLIWAGSFYAGTLSPKKPPPAPPSQTTAPHS